MTEFDKKEGVEGIEAYGLRDGLTIQFLALASKCLHKFASGVGEKLFKKEKITVNEDIQYYAQRLKGALKDIFGNIELSLKPFPLHWIYRKGNENGPIFVEIRRWAEDRDIELQIAGVDFHPDGPKVVIKNGVVIGVKITQYNGTQITTPLSSLPLHIRLDINNVLQASLLEIRKKSYKRLG